MRRIDKHRNAVIKSVITIKEDYVPAGYYGYPQLRNCWGFNSIQVTYTRNHMFLTVLPQQVKVVRRIHRWDKHKYPNGKSMIKALEHNNGKDLAQLLNQLDQTAEKPKVGIIRYIYRKVVSWFR